MIDSRVLLNTGKILTMILFNLACNNIVRAVYRWTTKYMVSKPQTLRWLHCFECLQLSWRPSWISDHDSGNKHLVWSNNCVASLVLMWWKTNNYPCGPNTCAEAAIWMASRVFAAIFFASVQNSSRFCDWHSTDLDSAGQNHIETTKKTCIYVEKHG